jgi:hypothetical protein
MTRSNRTSGTRKRQEPADAMSKGPPRDTKVGPERMAALPSKHLWRAKDVAAFMRCSLSSVYAHAERGQLPRIKVLGPEETLS